MANINGINTETGSVEIEIFTQTDAAIATLKEEYSDLSSVDIDSKDGYEFIKSGIRRLTKYRTSLDKKRKEIKQPILDAGKVLDSEAKRITAQLVALEEPMKDLKKEKDEREERIKQERIARLQQKVDALRAFESSARGLDSAGVADLMEQLDAIDTDNDFYDLTHEAGVAKRETMEKLGDIYSQRLEFERAEAERTEQERINRELREKQQREDQLNQVRMAPVNLIGKHSSDIQSAKDSYTRKLDGLDDSELESAINQTIAALDVMIKQAVEVEAAQQERQQVEENNQPTQEPVPTDVNDAIVTAPESEIIPDILNNPEPEEPEMVTITRAEYEQLIEDHDMLEALRTAGVHNWSGYDDAMASL